MILTLEEKRAIARTVISSHYGGLIMESRTDRLVHEDIKFNFKFYNALKETFSPQLHRARSVSPSSRPFFGGGLQRMRHVAGFHSWCDTNSGLGAGQGMNADPHFT